MLQLQLMTKHSSILADIVCALEEFTSMC